MGDQSITFITPQQECFSTESTKIRRAATDWMSHLRIAAVKLAIVLPRTCFFREASAERACVAGDVK